MVQTCSGEICRGRNLLRLELPGGRPTRRFTGVFREDMKLVDAREDAEVGRDGGGGFAVVQGDYSQRGRTGFITFNFCDIL